MSILDPSKTVIQKLLSSEDAESLRMEGNIADFFDGDGWDVNRSAYFFDEKTDKLREIDVYAAKVYDKPIKRKGVGGPIINFHVICECKNLKGANLLFVETASKKYDVRNLQYYWIGHDIKKLVRRYSEKFPNIERVNSAKIFNFLLSRAFPGEVSIVKSVNVPLPKIDMISRSFREVKINNQSDSNNAREKEKHNPIWNSILSIKSSLDAINVKISNVGQNYVLPDDVDLHEVQKAIEFSSFFFDAELLRISYVHPILLVRSKL